MTFIVATGAVTETRSKLMKLTWEEISLYRMGYKKEAGKSEYYLILTAYCVAIHNGCLVTVQLCFLIQDLALTLVHFL